MVDTLTIIICGGLILLSIVISIILANRSGWRKIQKIEAQDNAIEHYTKMRDKLTLADAGVATNSTTQAISSGFGGFSIIGGIISITIAAIVMANVLVPTIKSMNTTGLSPATSQAFSGLWSTTAVIIVVGFVFVILAVFGITNLMVRRY